MNVPCSMCLENPAAPRHSCINDNSRMCDCCEECTRACGDEFYKNIIEQEDEDLIRYWNSQ